ncbi:AlbA family DNA-binding domain-containing protein [Kribbella sp. WER1]
MRSHNLYTLPADEIDYDVVLNFVLDIEAANLVTESLTLELKLKPNGQNVVEAVAGLSNTDGGLVLVGVAEDFVGEERLVGVPRSTHDRLVNQFRSQIPTALPEVIPVAMPDGQSLIIVLRVDADAVPHPVTVSGRVLYRVPGATVPADRGRVIDLVDRDRAVDLGSSRPGHFMPAPSEYQFWSDDLDSLATIRIVGGLVLPGRISSRPWLGTAAREAAIDSLNGSPFPARCWGVDPQQAPWPGWEVTDARSTWLRLHGPAEDRFRSAGGVHMQASAYVQLVDRRLTVLLGLRWFPLNDKVVPLSFDSLYSALLAGLIAVTEATEAIAVAVGAAAPTEPAPFEAWLRPRDELRVADVVATSKFLQDGNERPWAVGFPMTLVSVADSTNLDRLAREWMNVALLDMGLKGFEAWLTDLQRPAWA